MFRYTSVFSRWFNYGRNVPEFYTRYGVDEYRIYANKNLNNAEKENMIKTINKKIEANAILINSRVKRWERIYYAIPLISLPIIHGTSYGYRLSNLSILNDDAKRAIGAVRGIYGNTAALQMYMNATGLDKIFNSPLYSSTLFTISAGVGLLGIVTLMSAFRSSSLKRANVIMHKIKEDLQCAQNHKR